MHFTVHILVFVLAVTAHGATGQVAECWKDAIANTQIVGAGIAPCAGNNSCSSNGISLTDCKNLCRQNPSCDTIQYPNNPALPLAECILFSGRIGISLSTISLSTVSVYEIDREDSDGDEVANSCDNCAVYNPTQVDTDSDGLPDSCDNCTLAPCGRGARCIDEGSEYTCELPQHSCTRGTGSSISCNCPSGFEADGIVSHLGCARLILLLP